MPRDVTISVRSPAGLAELEAVDQGLGDFNDQHQALNDVRPLHVIAQDRTGRTIGGAIGRTWGECCDLQQVWVKPELRRSAIGQQLMSAFEQEARTRGCKLIYLETFSFQAPDFYRRAGFTPVLVTKGFTQGVVKFNMQKQLVGPALAITASSLIGCVP